MARALLAVPKKQRADLCRLCFVRAGLALCYVHQHNHPHPIWGNGSLDAVARATGLVSEPFWDDPAYIGCLQLTLEELQTALKTA